MKFPRYALAGVAALALTLSACSAEAGNTTADASDYTLKLSMPAAPPSLAVGALDQGVSSVLWASIYDSLLSRASNGEIQPSAAESWDVSEDGLTLTFTLRDGMTFSNGDAVDAAAVVASLTQSQTAPATSSSFVNVGAIEAADASTVTITLTAPDSALPYALAQSAGAIGDPDELGSDTAALDPVGSGPYVLDDTATTDGSIYTLKKRDGYWNTDAYAYKTVAVKVIADTTAQINAMQAGELDYITLPDASQAAPLKSAGLTVGESSPTAWAGIYIADRAGAVQPALADERVRQAINLAIDRDAIVEKLMGGVGESTEQIYDPGTAVYDDELNEAYPYDVDKAKALMADAGYADGFTVSMPSSVLSQTYEPTISQQLGEIGITIDWQPVPFDQVVSSLSSQSYPMFWFFNGYNVPQIDTRASLAVDGTFNPFHSADEELTSLIATAQASPTPADADVNYRAVNEWVVDNAWFAPVFAYVSIYATSTAVDYTPREVSGIQTLDLYQPAS